MTALVHLYRGEISRANAWRSRLDTTTNWAVGATGAFISIAFGDLSTHHSLLLLGSLLITCFLAMEAHRYRYYSLWSYRVRLLETNFYAALLHPDQEEPSSPGDVAYSNCWMDTLSSSLQHPRFQVSLRVALGRRLGRGYIWIYTVLFLAWVLKLSLYPTQSTSIAELAGRASLLSLPGSVILVAVILAYMALLVMLSLHLYWEESSGEPRFEDLEKR